MERKHYLVILFILFVVPIFIYWESLFYSFFILDDPAMIYRHRVIATGLNLQSVFWFLKHSHVATWHPITSLFHLVDVSMFGLHPQGHHLTNLILHILNSFLVFFVAKEILKNFRLAFLAALVFSVHPLHVESVVWISSKKNLISFFFMFLALLSYFKYKKTTGARYFWYSWFLFILGLMSKPILVTFPFLLMVIDCTRYMGNQFSLMSKEKARWLLFIPELKRSFYEKIPFFIASAVFSVLVYSTQSAGGALKSDSAYEIWIRVFNTFNGYWFYLYNTFIPSNLCVLYPFPDAIPWLGFSLGLFVCATLSVIAWVFRRRTPSFLLGWLWLIGTLIPVIGLVRIGSQAYADRYAYHAQPGLLIAVFAIVGLLRWNLHKKSIIVLTCIYSFWVLSLINTSLFQVKIWASDKQVFEHNLKHTVNNWTALGCLGRIYLEEGELEKAGPLLNSAFMLRPEDAMSNYQMGLFHAQKGEFEQAKSFFLMSLSVEPDDGEYLFQTGTMALKTSDFPLALSCFNKAQSNEPEDAILKLGLGMAYEGLERWIEAENQYLHLLSNEPYKALAYYHLGLVKHGQRQFSTAIDFLKKSYQLNPNPEIQTLIQDMAELETGRERINHSGSPPSDKRR